MIRLVYLLALVACTPATPPTAPAPVPVVAVKAAPVPPPVADTVPYLQAIRDASEFYFGVPAPVPVIVAQIEQESHFRPAAVSPAGASGLMQIMPATAKWAAQAGGFGVANTLDPAWSIRAGTWYDRYLYDRVRAPNSKCDRWLFALSSYNGGEGWTQKRQARSKSPGSWAMTGNINPGITESNQHENASYGPRIIYALQPKYLTLGPLVCKGDT